MIALPHFSASRRGLLAWLLGGMTLLPGCGGVAQKDGGAASSPTDAIDAVPRRGR